MLTAARHPQVLGHTYQSMLFGVSNQIYAELTVQPRLASQIITGGQLGALLLC